MNDPKAPYIVRAQPVRAQPGVYIRPGQHSHNTGRRRPPVYVKKTSPSWVHGLRLLLLIVGLCGIGYYGYTVCDQYLYQAYENWAFDQSIAGRAHVTFGDYVRERTPFGFLAPSKRSEAAQSANANPAAPVQPRPAEGAVLGRVEIARLNLAAVVREGVDAHVLSVAVGHVPSTAMPGEPGNFAIAAHRDTLFRVLKDIQQGDLVSFQAPSGTYIYKVVATKIVRPSDVTVLRPDGGGVIPPSKLVSNDGDPNKLLTMITCYPFYYVGSAPKRFIVEAELVGGPDTAHPPPKRLS